MTKSNNESETMIDESSEESTENKYLLSNESYEMLRSAQREIMKVTEFMPSLRKVINKLVNQEAVDQMKYRFIEELK